MKLTAQQVASFDQAYTASRDIFVQLATTYVMRRVQDEREQIPEQATIVALAEHLADEWDVEALVSALTAAVVAFAEKAMEEAE